MKTQFLFPNQFKKIRPKDISIQKAISSKKELVEFYFSKTSSLISGIGSKNSENWGRNKENSDVVRLESKTLFEVFRENNVPNLIDLLSIDVEGGEISVLDSMNFELYKPRVILIEIHEFLISTPEQDPIYRKIISHGYRLKSYANPTALFISNVGF